MKKIVYVDLDGVMADYASNMAGTTKEDRMQPGFFENLTPIEGSIDGFKKLSERYQTFFLSTAPWSNIYAPSEKRIWVEKHLGDYAFKKLILTHHKGLLIGDYLIDDRIANGVSSFKGEHLHFGSKHFPDWDSILAFLI